MAIKKNAEKPPYSGYFLKFEQGRIGKIRENLGYPGEASESFSAMDWTFERREIALLSLTPGEACIDAVVLMERMHGSGGTGKLKMRMWTPVIIGESIRPREIADAFHAAERVCSAETFQRIPQDEWPLVINAIKRLRPALAKRLDELIALRSAQNRLTGSDTKILRLTEQRDAIGLALDVASLDRQTILRKAKFEQIDSARSALDLLDLEPQQEQDLIRHDQNVFAGLLSTQDMHSAQFTGGGGRKVRVHIYDKKPLETVLGIDLLIYLDEYKSYLLLQYKCMEPKNDDEGKTWSYLVDSQMNQQIQAMSNAVDAFTRRPAPVSPSMADWRLSNEAFFFKFCETTRPDARDDALVAGLTLSHSHLMLFLQLPDSHGKYGGQRIGYGNCARYLNNSQFIDLAREGWIGCDQLGFALISQVIAEGQKRGKSAMFAVIEGSGSKTAQDRRKRIR